MLTPLVNPVPRRVRARSRTSRTSGYGIDLQREHRFLKELSPEQVERWRARSFPSVFELNFRGIPG